MSRLAPPKETNPVAAYAEPVIENIAHSPGVMRFVRIAKRVGLTGRNLVIGIPYLWLLLFFLLPFAIVLKIALADSVLAIPPYTPLFEIAEDLQIKLKVTFDNFRFLLSDSLYVTAYLSSVRIAAVSTFLCLLIGYPMAYGMAKSSPGTRNLLLMLVILPFWTSFLIRVYAWKVILQSNGVVNAALMSMGIIDEPLRILYSDAAVYLGIVYSYVPFMILPLYATLERMDETLIEAAQDLGCPPWKAFLTITLPLSVPGIIAGSLLVFIPAVGEFVIPELLGGPDSFMIGRVLWNEFFANRDWPVASAVAIAILAFLIIPIMIFQYYQGKEAEGEEKR